MSTPGDLPREELAIMAEKAVAFYGKAGKVNVYFKATCPVCGARPIFCEPNVMYDNMECSECETVFPFTEGGFLLEINP